MFLDIGFGVAVDDRQSSGRCMLGHELAVLAPKCFAETDWGVAAEVRQSFPFFFAHVVVVGQPGSTDRRPPLVAGYPGGVRVAHAVANVVVVADGIERFAFGVVGSSLQQLRVEDLLFDVGVYIELVGERTPYPFECALVDRRLRLQIVELGELFAKPVMVGEDQHGDVSHSDSQPPLTATGYGHRVPRWQNQSNSITPNASKLSGTALRRTSWRASLFR